MGWVKITEDPNTWPKHGEFCWVRQTDGRIPSYYFFEFHIKDMKFKEYTRYIELDALTEATHWSPATPPPFDGE